MLNKTAALNVFLQRRLFKKETPTQMFGESL